MKYRFNYFLCILLLLSISSCQVINVRDKNFKTELVKGGDFWITTYQKITDPTRPYVFYLEGDRKAFYGEQLLLNNLTPTKNTVLQLIALDTRPNVVYIASPCQYASTRLNPKCTSQYWTHKRFSENIVSAIDSVINKINNKQKFSLIGYAEGGTIAVLIAARDNLVKDIITISSNLDTTAFAIFHQDKPMIGSLNPIDYTEQVKHIPQLHLSGGKDKIVPPFLAHRFVKKASSLCVKQRILPNVAHSSGWRQNWGYILSEPLHCS